MIRSASRGCVWALLLGLSLVPIAIFILYGFAQRWFYPAIWPQEWSLRAFQRQWNSPIVLAASGRSLLIASLVTVLALLVAYPAARALELRQVPGKQLMYALLFIPTVVPTVAVGIGLNILFLRIGLNGTMLGVALVHLVPVLPYTVLTLGGVFAAYDATYEQQARVLGANRWHTWRRVTLPLIFPGLVVTSFFSFLISWSQYLLTFLIGGGRVFTLPMLLFSAANGGENANISVLVLIFIAPLLILIALTARYLAGTSTPQESIIPS